MKTRKTTGWLNDQAQYDFVRAFVKAGRARPMVGNLLDKNAVTGIGAAAKNAPTAAAPSARFKLKITIAPSTRSLATEATQVSGAEQVRATADFRPRSRARRSCRSRASRRLFRIAR